MKQLFKAMCIMTLLLMPAGQLAAGEKKELCLDKAGENARISYALGYDIVEKLNRHFDLDPEFFEAGIKDARNADPKLSAEEIRQLLLNYHRTSRQKQMEAARSESRKNREIGSRFMADNITRQGVKNLPSGLQYKVLVKGNGPVPKLSDTVECHYRGKLLDGTVFDSSYDRGKPAVFQISELIPGWLQALEKMPVGSKWVLYIPADLAYGDKGAGGLIRPGATLIFEMQLLSIVE